MTKQENLLNELLCIEQESKEISREIKQLEKQRCKYEYEIKKIKNDYFYEIMIHLTPLLFFAFILTFTIVFPEKITSFNLFINKFYPLPFELNLTTIAITVLLYYLITAPKLVDISTKYETKLTDYNEPIEHYSDNLKHYLYRKLQLDKEKINIKKALAFLEKEELSKKQLYINLRNTLLKIKEEKEYEQNIEKKYIKK